MKLEKQKEKEVSKVMNETELRRRRGKERIRADGRKWNERGNESRRRETSRTQTCQRGG